MIKCRSTTRETIFFLTEKTIAKFLLFENIALTDVVNSSIAEKLAHLEYILASSSFLFLNILSSLIVKVDHQWVSNGSPGPGTCALARPTARVTP
jgi:hypothetical protein